MIHICLKRIHVLVFSLYLFLKDLNVVIIGNFLFVCLYNVCDVSQKVTKEF